MRQVLTQQLYEPDEVVSGASPPEARAIEGTMARPTADAAVTPRCPRKLRRLAGGC